jgi:hypothetical protein
VALAHLGNWKRARDALLRGHHLQPRDKRFAIELAGIDFKQKRYSDAAGWLRRALSLDPDDRYTKDFLGSVYYLNGNLEAALKYWNRVSKPRLAQVRVDPELRVDPALLDSAFAFSVASTLTLPELLATRSRTSGLGIFPRQVFELGAQSDGSFDLIFRALERNGWGRTKREGLLNLFRGVYLQTVYPEFYNLGRSATNVVSLIRWDKEKRRLAVSLSGPLRRQAKRRYLLGLDLRNENWDIRSRSRGPAPVLGSLNLRRDAVRAGVSSFPNGQWVWSTGVELSRRNFRNVLLGSALEPELLADGYQLKHLVEAKYELWRVPERRLVVDTTASSELGRIWSQPSHVFAQLEAGMGVRWFPQARGEDYEMQGRLRVGKTYGVVPFDELFLLGLERDNDLRLRAHIGSRDGRKGSAPLGRGYFLANWEADKIAYSHGLLNVKLSPFVDVGKVLDATTGLASRQWLWDTGLQAKLRVLGVGTVVTYGKDLRTGSNVFYVALGR